MLLNLRTKLVRAELVVALDPFHLVFARIHKEIAQLVAGGAVALADAQGGRWEERFELHGFAVARGRVPDFFRGGGGGGRAGGGLGAGRGGGCHWWGRMGWDGS